MIWGTAVLLYSMPVLIVESSESSDWMIRSITISIQYLHSFIATGPSPRKWAAIAEYWWLSLFILLFLLSDAKYFYCLLYSSQCLGIAAQKKWWLPDVHALSDTLIQVTLENLEAPWVDDLPSCIVKQNSGFCTTTHANYAGLFCIGDIIQVSWLRNMGKASF